MSTKAVIVWLFLAIVLGLAAFFLLRGPSGTGATAASVAVGTRLLEFKPGDVQQITVDTPADGMRQIIERPSGGKGVLGADADWQLRIVPIKPSGTDATPAAAAPWPLQPSSVQSLLRVLAETQAVAPAPADASLGDRPTTVQLQLANGTSTWTLADRTLAGTGLVQFDGPKIPMRRAVVRDDLHLVFIDPGPRGWRERFPFGGIAPDASRIHLESPAHTLILARAEGKWFLREPAPAPADPQAVQRLIAELVRVQIADFLDAGSEGTSTGMEHPVATIRVEADRRSIEPGAAEPKVSTDSLEIVIGGAAGSKGGSGGNVYASVNKTKLVLLDGRSVGLTNDPATYTWPHPMREVASNIGGFAVTLDAKPGTTDPATPGRSYRRSGAKWTQTLPTGGEAPVSDSEQRGVNDVLAFLTGERIASVQGASAGASSAKPTITFFAPAGATSFGTLRVNAISGDALDTLDLLLVDADKVSVRTAKVWRTYAIGTLPALLQNAASAAAPPPTR